MKKLLILTYVIIVATLSISARANENIPLLLNSIQYDLDAQIFQIEGQYPNPCTSNPTPQLTQNKDGQLILEVTGQSNAEVCITVLGPRFLLALDLKVLKAQLAELKLDENGVQSIFDGAQNLIATVDFSKIFFSIPVKSTSIEGFLSQDDRGLYLLDPQGLRINVLSPLINIEDLRESDVVLTGHMMSHAVSIPLFNSKKPALQFIATGVSFKAAN